MSFPRYPEYKDSGVGWLGEVPGHWRLLRANAVLDTSRNSIEASALNATQVFHYSIPVVQDTGDGQIEDGTEIDSSKMVISEPQVLVSKLNPRKGTTCVATPKAELTVCSSEFVPLIPRDADINFVSFLVQTDNFRQRLESLVESATRSHQRVLPSDIHKFRWAFPEQSEQTQIAAFLDRETAKIDALVAEQRRLMALLKEKRQAVISHAVTRGLNPDAPMKPSGIEWLGDVPAHWEVLKGTLIGTIFGSEQVPEDAVLDEGDLPFIKVGSLSRDSFEIESWDYFVDRDVAAKCRPRSNYIVFPKRGAAIFTNKVNIVERPSLIDPNLMGWEIGERAVTAFVAYALKCRKLDELADVSTVPQINNKHIAPERFAVPPLKEQHQIVAYLHAESAKFDTLTAEAQRAIDLLQERRTTLISAAVTGQIDVRVAI